MPACCSCRRYVRAGSAISPEGLALFQKGIDTFQRVFCLEQSDEGFAFGRTEGVRSPAAYAVDQRLDGANRHRALAGDARCQQQGMATCFARLDDLLDQADAQCRFGIEAFTAEDHALGPSFSHQPGQCLGAAGTGQQPYRSFRKAQLSLSFGDANVAGKRAFQAAAQGETVDGRDRYAAKVAQGLEGFAETARHFPRANPVAIGEELQVGAGAEEFLTLAADDQCVDVVVVIEMLDHQLEADQRFSIPGIGGRMVDGDQCRVAVLLDGQLVGQVEDAGLVGFDGSTHGLDPRKLVGALLRDAILRCFPSELAEALWLQPTEGPLGRARALPGGGRSHCNCSGWLAERRSSCHSASVGAACSPARRWTISK